MLIPRVSQVPIREPMYIDGVMTPTWLRFFEQLAALINSGDLADYVTLAQLANQLPTQAMLGQHELALQQQTFDMIPAAMLSDTSFDLMPPHVSAAPVFDITALPPAGVITP